MKVVFFGTSSFAAGVLHYLFQKDACQIVAVVTRPDRPQGRSLRLIESPVASIADKLHVPCPVLKPIKASTDEFCGILKSLHADLFIVVAYGEIVKKNILALPRLGCVNIHASLLPLYRGAAPIHRAIMGGEKETGVTIIEMAEGMDAGPILKKKVISIDQEDVFGDVQKKLLEASIEALWETIEDYKSGVVKRELQNESQATYAPKIVPEDEKIDWNLSAQELNNRIRAFSPYPGAFCLVRIKGLLRRLKITRAAVDVSQKGVPGTIVEQSKQSLAVACGDGVLRFVEVQLEGKKNMTIQEFLQGLQAPLELA